MKTAISIPDDLFETAEQFAARHGLSRSELVAKALRHYLQALQAESITEQLNALYDDVPSRLDQDIIQAQASSLPKEEW